MNEAGFNIPEGLPKKINSAKSFLVVLPQNLNIDRVAAGLALFLALEKAKKRVKIGCSSQMTVEYNRLFGVDKITPNIGSRNLTISLPEEAVEKVSSQTEDGRLNLTIKPKNGATPIEQKDIKYSYSGADAEIIFTIGAQKLEDLGEIYQQENQAFEKVEIINIDINPANTKFAQKNLIFPQQVSLSQLTAKIFKKLGLAVSQDIATNIIAGIESATNNLQVNTNADTFEILAWAMRQGGKQGHLKTSPVQPTTPPFAKPQPAQPTAPSPFAPPTGQAPAQNAQTQQTQTQPAQTPLSVSQPGLPPAENQQPESKKEKESPTPAPDWFKPKIFSGGRRKG